MWAAVAALVAMLAAGVTYWLKKSADKSVESYVLLENDLQSALERGKIQDKTIVRLRLLNAQLTRDLVRERRKNFNNLNADGAADELRRPETNSTDA